MVEYNSDGTMVIKDGLGITQDEAYSLAEFIDLNLIQSIRDDVDIDSMQWLRNMIHSYEKLCAYSGYVGLTDDTPERIEDDE